ncbi:MAG: PhoD-like phosphatase N-terminal domain-containing protein, partial [Bacteroidota bacterium]
MRSLLGISMLVIAFHTTGLAQSTSILHLHPELVRELNPNLAPFYHGVASGDPTQHAVILWTRVTLDRTVREAWVNWELATDRDFEQVVARGKVHTGPEKGFTVKTGATGLTPGTTYYYRFQHGSTHSMVGQTQTLPADPSSFHLAFASCSNYEWGY